MNQSKKIFVFTGKKASGKTTAANYIVDVFNDQPTYNNGRVEKLSFAGPLKDFCINALGLRSLQCWGEDKEKNTETRFMWESLVPSLREKFGKSSGPVLAREILQIVGTDVFRNHFCDTVWVEAAVLETERSKADVVVFDDARYPNELEALKKQGAVIIRMLRSNAPVGDTHISECALDSYPMENYNYVIGPDVEGIEAVRREMHQILIKEGIL
jgi:hypothetical protein